MRRWLGEHCPDGGGEIAVEGCTGWRYVVEELTAAGVVAHLADPAETAGLRGPKKRAKTDRADARLLRTLLWEGRLPESWIPSAQVAGDPHAGPAVLRVDGGAAGLAATHARAAVPSGCPPIGGLLTEAGREALATAELSAAGRQYVDTAMRRIDALSEEIDPLRRQLVNFARRQPGCLALQARHYGVGWLCAVIIWAEIGDVRRFRRSDQLVRFAGLDVTVYSSDGKRSPGHLSRQGSPELRWAAFEAARCAARPGRRTTPTTTRWRTTSTVNGPTLAVERKLLRRCYHTLRDLGDAAVVAARPRTEVPPESCEAHVPCPQPADACGRFPQRFLSPPRPWVDVPERMNDRTPRPPACRAPHPSSCRRTLVRGPR